jgi:hypothetical protein
MILLDIHTLKGGLKERFRSKSGLQAEGHRTHADYRPKDGERTAQGGASDETKGEIRAGGRTETETMSSESHPPHKPLRHL